jgi:hypothetical protein
MMNEALENRHSESPKFIKVIDHSKKRAPTIEPTTTDAIVKTSRSHPRRELVREMPEFPLAVLDADGADEVDLVVVAAACIAKNKKSHNCKRDWAKKTNRTPTTLAVEASLGVGGVTLVPFIVKPLPMLLTGVHDDEEIGGWGGGVMGSPWWKVEPP